jgi:hypothetical protein
MFRRTPHHPQGERLSLAPNCLRTVMLLLRLLSVRYITCGFYNVMYYCENNI